MTWAKPLPLYEVNVSFFFLHPQIRVRGWECSLLDKEERRMKRRMKISLAPFTLYFASCVDVYEMIPCTSLHL